MINLVLRKGKEKSLLRRHPWVYDTAVKRVEGDPELGETVRVLSFDGRFLAWAAYSPESSIRARCWSFNEDEVIDEAWFEKKLRHAIEARANLWERTNAVRVIFAENDGLPGLVVDQYDNVLVAQFLSAGVHRHKALIAKLLKQITNAVTLWDRSDASACHREGLPLNNGLLWGEEPPEAVEVVEDGVRYGIDVRNGHKTGFYVDQRESRLTAQKAAEAFRKKHGRGMRALNCFSYTGGFSLALLKGGADEVISVDSSQDALDMAKRNAERNGFGEDKAKFVCEDVFQYLRRMRDAGETFDLVILDPPKFASSHRHVTRASRAYKDINLLGLRLLEEGGQLFTFSCSGAIDVDLFQKIIAGAVFDAGCDAWAVGRFAGGEDHPLLMTYPEGEYLKGLHLLVRS